jgi:hypothetical protein
MEATDRDRRTMNRMDPETRMVHIRLEAWGRWSKGGMPRAYPEATLLARCIEQGITGASQTGRAPTAMPDHIAAVDAAVCRLGRVDEKGREAIREYYVQEQSIEDCARHLRMQVRQFQNILRRSRWRVGAYLDTDRS